MRLDFGRRQAARSAPRRSASAILLIEPDAACRDIAALLVRHYGYEVLEAATFTEGMHMARAVRPDGIVSELLVDSHGDRTVVDALGRDAATARIPVLVLSDPLPPEQRERALGAGAVAVLQKPVNGQELRDTLILHVGEPADAAASQTAA